MFVARPLKGITQSAKKLPSTRHLCATAPTAARPRPRPAPKKRIAEPAANSEPKKQLLQSDGEAKELPPLPLLNAAKLAKALDIEPLAARTVLADYIKLSGMRSKGSWERHFWAEHNITTRTLVLLALILIRCKDGPRAQLATDLLLSASAMGDPSATIYLVNQGLQKEKLDLQLFRAPLDHLRILAAPPHLNTEAMVLLGKIYESRTEEDKALQMYRQAVATETAPEPDHEFPLPSMGDPLSTALVREAHILQRHGNSTKAKNLFKEAAITHGDPEGTYQFALLQKPNSPKRENFLLAAASAGIVPAATGLGEVYLEKARAAPTEKATQLKLAKEWLFLGATAGEGKSMIVLANTFLEEGNLESAQNWLTRACKSADPAVIDAARHLTVKLEASQGVSIEKSV